jgi:transposase
MRIFKDWDVQQVMMFPPSVQEFVPEGHLAHFVRETVREGLDLSEILDGYGEERGQPPYHPVMMTALLLYGYCQGVYSSRRLARACTERVDFMAVTAMSQPDFRTISDFRKRHLKALQGLFVQVLRLCQKQGLVKLGHVALDGTKVKANASRHKAMSYGRMLKSEAELAAQVRQWMERAGTEDAREDHEHGPEHSGEQLPEWVSSKQARLDKIREAKAALEAEARAKSTAAVDDSSDGEEKPRRGRPPKSPPGVPKDSAQRNFTDPQSRIMKSGDGFVQAYNGQAAVDSHAQIIVAQTLTNNAADATHLPTMVAQIKENTSRQTRELSADAGYCSEENLKELSRRRIEGFVATGRQKHGTAAASGGERGGRRLRAMRLKLKRAGHRSRYRLRKQVVEPVFGQIKHARGFRQFLLRGLEKVSAEWSLICTAHNLLKLAGARR